MKSIYPFMLIIAGMFLLTACPVSSSYPLGKKGEVALDKQLIGVWKNDSEETESKGVTITKGKELNTYNVHVDEKGSMFMADGDDFIGWLTVLKGKTFFVLQQVIDGVATEIYFVYHIKYNNSTLITNDISLLVKGTDAITSIESYQEEVIASMEMDEFLTSEIQWEKE
jgi:hypothetical protein